MSCLRAWHTMLYTPELMELGLPLDDLTDPIDMNESERSRFSRHLPLEQYIRARAGIASIVSSIERVNRYARVKTFILHDDRWNIIFPYLLTTMIVEMISFPIYIWQQTLFFFSIDYFVETRRLREKPRKLTNCLSSVWRWECRPPRRWGTCITMRYAYIIMCNIFIIYRPMYLQICFIKILLIYI